MPLRPSQLPARQPDKPLTGRPARRPSPGSAAARANGAANPNADVCEVSCIDGAKVERVRQAAPAPATLATLAETFKVLGDPTRLMIVTALAREELCVCDLATLVGVSQSAVSHSLRTLRQLRLVRYRKVGKIAYYALDDAHVAMLVTEGMRHVEERAPSRIGAEAG